MGIFHLHRLLAFLIIAATFLCTVFSYTKNESKDIQALLEFKSKITSDPLHIMQSWNKSTSLCQWYGVECGSRHKRVKALYLNSTKITGTLSPHMGNLSFVRELILENNSFTGNIPPEIGRLRRLRFLSLSNNPLTGRIPFNMSNCHNLEVIDFSGNYLEGEIPPYLGSLTKLTYLLLRKNNFHGRIPPSLCNLSALEGLTLTENKLSGVLPNTLGQLNRLVFFGVASNRLSGSIPLSMYNLSSLFMFSASDNMIHGSLPSDLFTTLPKLHYFLIRKNRISGNIPISLSNASNLAFFQNNYNKFTGRFPSLEKLHKLISFSISYNHHGYGGIGDLDFLCSLTNNTNLDVLDIRNNNLGGILPKCIGNLSSVNNLAMGGNTISGPVRSEIGRLIKLEVLSMQENQLSGEIPSSIGNLENLVYLLIQGNKLWGNIPSSLGNLKQLSRLTLFNNKLEGTIPHTLGECKSLNYLHLSGNDLTGSIPIEIFQLSSLLQMIVSQNHLVGPLPKSVENLTNLNYLDVSENMLSQTIPSSLGNCINLQELHMEGNFFQGMIPPSLGYLRGIDVIDLSRNNLSGQIPRSLAMLMLIVNLNLSNNDLEGPVPEDGVFKNISRFSIIGNKKLCGGIPELSLPKCNREISHKKASHTIVKVVMSVLGGLLGLFCLIGILLCYLLRKKESMVTQNFSSDPLLRLSYQNLLKATNGFSLTNKLGSGSFGSVYKAILDTSERIVAVKVFDLERHGASRSFLTECEILKRIRHRNLVRILTACSSIDFSGNEFKALVYEFMENGSLDDWLHLCPSREGISQAQKHLGFIQRLNIAIDVACALDYLHNHYEIPIIHRDIKPNNVLLNDEMIGHVSDFGLSKILLDASNNNITGPTSSVGFNGTIGYVAPEYGMGAFVSTQGDVYSYGILLLEMFTGKRPTDVTFHQGINVNCFVKAALPDKVMELVDPTLHAELEEKLSNATRSVLKYLIAIFEIGVSCSANLSSERKSIKDVVRDLKSIRDKLS